MAKTFFLNNYNNSGGSGAVAMFGLKTALVAAGWTVAASGAGNGGASNIGGADVCANFTNQDGSGRGPWVVLQMPGSTRQISIAAQAWSGTGRGARIKYSRLGLFVDGPRINGVVTGSISGVFPASASDEQLVLFNGSINDDTSGGSGGAIFVSDADHITHYMVDNAAPYGFWLVGHRLDHALTQADHVFILDPLTSVDPLDADAYVLYASNTGGNPTSHVLFAGSGGSLGTVAGNANGPYTFTRHGLTNETWSRCVAPAPGSYSGNTIVYPDAVGSNIYNGGGDSLPLLYTNVRTGQGSTFPVSTVKGYSTLMRWKGASSQNLDLFNAATPGDKIAFDSVILDWNNTVPRLS